MKDLKNEAEPSETLDGDDLMLPAKKKKSKKFKDFHDDADVTSRDRTNDLRAQQERVAISLRAVIEKASNTFPNSKIIISTLLPCKDFHPYTIQKISASIARECALRPNTHLAHPPTLAITTHPKTCRWSNSTSPPSETSTPCPSLSRTAR
ncbi:hypothetical protein MHYP_G00290140 [Metynnis hypsauchen]